jgi:hypothetical protein
MRAFNSRHRSVVFSAAVAAVLAGAACKREVPSGPVTLTVANATDLPAVYSPQQCANIIGQFPGWANVTPVPESDAQGRPTMFYAAITITNPIQLAELKAVGIQTDTMPMFMDPDTRAKFDGQVGYVSKSTCGGAEIVWGMVPGPIFNLIAQDTVKFNETLVEAIVFLPLPDQVADASTTYNGVHPLAYTAARNAGFRAPDDPPPSQPGTVAVAGLWDDFKSAASSAWNDVKGAAKDVVQDGAKGYNDIKNGIPTLSGIATCWAEDCVQVGVHLDIRNVDPAFGGQSLAGGNDGTTPMVRAWGSQANQPLSLTGVQLTLRQSDDLKLFSWPISFNGTVQPDGTATVKAVTGKNTDFCLTLENYAATLNDELTARQLCSFSHILTTTTGAPRANTTFSGNDQVNLRLEDKYVNVMAQLTDGYDYLKTVASYTPQKAKVLSGWPLDVPGIEQLLNGRAVTPCLNFPDVAVEGINQLLDSTAKALPPPFDALGFVFAGALEATYEDDMWLPDSGDILVSRGIASHEYGHFAMCSLLSDEDPTKMVNIPSLIVQRVLDGEYGDATDEAAYIMEGWADFFAGQLASGANYFDMENEIGDESSMTYCKGDSQGPCWDWNYVDDMDATSAGGTGSIGFLHQVRRVATTLHDAFDGHPFGTDMPGQGDFWTQTGSNYLAEASSHNGDAHDEVIALPGSDLRTLIHNWTHQSWGLGIVWAVDQAQFFGALNQTIRNERIEAPLYNYSWCDVCKMFAQHDSLSCSITGNTSSGGVCVAAGDAPTEPQMSIQQMVTVCEESPTIPGFIGGPPATDPATACTFTGCPPHTILVGEVGVPGAVCTACGAHQISSGSQSCPATECAVANSSGTTCLDCADAQIVGGADGNTCVSCPALQVPNADRTACVPCAPHQIASGVACVDCANNQIAAADNTCQACPEGQIPYSNQGVVGSTPTYGESCLPATECTCGSSYCRATNANGICVDTIG